VWFEERERYSEDEDGEFMTLGEGSGLIGFVWRENGSKKREKTEGNHVMAA